MRLETKISRGKQREKVSCYLFQQGFLVYDIKTQETNSKIEKWDYIKLRSSCTAKKKKKTINRMRRQSPECEKIFAKYIFEKRLISKLYKELL